MHRIPLFLSSLVMIALLAGCGEEPADTGQLRVIHAAPGGEPLSVSIQAEPELLFGRVAYGEASGYRRLPPGYYTLIFRSRVPGKRTPIFQSAVVFLRPGEKLTLVAASMASVPDPGRRFRILSLSEQASPPGEGKARIRVLHASPDAPPVGIDIGDDRSVEVERLEPYAATADGIEVPAGQSLQLALRTGTNNEDQLTSFTLPPLAAGSSTLVVATGLAALPENAPDALSLLPVGSRAMPLVRQNPVIVAVHAVPDRDVVDLFAGDRKLVSKLIFATLSQPIRLPAGENTLALYPPTPGATPPAGAPSASARTPRLESGQRYYLVAAGAFNAGPGDPPLTFIPIADDSAHMANGAAYLRLAHASIGAPPVALGLSAGGKLQGPPLLSGIPFGHFSAPRGVMLMPAVPRSIGVTAAGSNDVLMGFDFGYFSITPNARLIVVAAGDLRPGGDKPFGLLIIDATQFPGRIAGTPH